MATTSEKSKSLESWIWDAACSIRGAKDAAKYNLFKIVGRSGHGTCTLVGHEVAAFKIQLPDLKTQDEIASGIQSLERKKDLHSRKCAQLQDLFHTLLHELMTAWIRVNTLALSFEKYE